MFLIVKKTRLQSNFIFKKISAPKWKEQADEARSLWKKNEKLNPQFKRAVESPQPVFAVLFRTDGSPPPVQINLMQVSWLTVYSLTPPSRFPSGSAYEFGRPVTVAGPRRILTCFPLSLLPPSHVQFAQHVVVRGT